MNKNTNDMKIIFDEYEKTMQEVETISNEIKQGIIWLVIQMLFMSVFFAITTY